MPAFSRPYNRGSVTTPNKRVGRKTICDGCDKPKPDCIFVEREESGAMVCLCASCRSQPWAKGKIRHADPDYPTVPL
jgi:hypothetical protein